jgi:CMP-N-acetylneuraminic acid synthetase
MEVLALIPARGGSKSIPRKNIRSFAGHPLLAYSIAAGLAAETVSRVLVSTDDDEIAAIARSYGAEVPFMRPEDCSQDHTPDLPVFQHALHWLEEHEGYTPDIVVQLRPTSPLRRVAHIDGAVLRLLERPAADAVRTVCVPFQNPFKMWLVNASGEMQPLIQPGWLEQLAPGLQFGLERIEPYNLPRQALPTVYWQTGYVDAAWADTILAKNSMTGDLILPLIISPEEWIDIDSADDWQRAERMLQSGEISFDDLGFHLP